MPEAANDDRFARFTALVRTLRQAQALDFVQSAEKEDDLRFWIHDYAPSYNVPVRRLLDLLNISGVATDGNDIFLPLSSLL